MQGGTAATQEVFIENVGQPTLACIRPAVDALQDLNAHREVQLVISGGIRNGADVAKALALGADAVSIGSAAMIAIGDNDPKWEKEYNKLGSTAGAYDDWHEGNDPAGISTQNPKLMKRLDPIKAGKKLTNYLKVMTLEAQTLARAAPLIPIAGMPNHPKINIGSKIAFMIAVDVMSVEVVFESPDALKTEFPIMGTAIKIPPRQ